MINSRSLDELDPFVKDLALQFLQDCKTAGIDILITCTYRDNEAQQACYDQGRTPESISKGEKIITNAKPGQSFHQWRVAIDTVPIINGKAVWSDNLLWNKIGAIGVNNGFEWAGNWISFKEKPHFQLTGGLKCSDFAAGKKLADVLQRTS